MFRFSLDLHDANNYLTKLVMANPDSKNVFAAYDFQTYFIKPASPIMYGISDLHDFIMIYLVFIVFFVTFMLLIILKDSTINENNEIEKFNKVKKLYNVKFNHHSLLETIWIVIPSLILLSIAIPSFILLYAMDIIPGHDFSIKVIGHQWYWSYEYIMKNIFAISAHKKYGDSNISIKDCETLYRYSFDSYMIPSDELKDGQLRLLDTTNPLVLPIARYASVTVTSVDVIHSFAVPSLAIKIDAIPGRLNTVAMYIMELGHYYGQCSELCGVNHGFMPIEIYCVDIVGFTIYKAILSSKIVTKDIISKEVGVYEKMRLIEHYNKKQQKIENNLYKKYYSKSATIRQLALEPRYPTFLSSTFLEKLNLNDKYLGFDEKVFSIDSAVSEYTYLQKYQEAYALAESAVIKEWQLDVLSSKIKTKYAYRNACEVFLIKDNICKGLLSIPFKDVVLDYMKEDDILCRFNKNIKVLLSLVHRNPSSSYTASAIYTNHKAVELNFLIKLVKANELYKEHYKQSAFSNKNN